MGWHEDSVFAVSIGRDLEDRALADIGLAEEEADASHFAAGRGFRSELEGGVLIRQVGGADGHGAGLGWGDPAVVRVGAGEDGAQIGSPLVLDQGGDGDLVLDLPYFLSGSSMQEDNSR